MLSFIVSIALRPPLVRPQRLKRKTPMTNMMKTKTTLGTNERPGEEELGGAEDDLGDQRQFLIGVGEHFLELRHDENHQEDQDGDGDEHDDHRIDHRGNDLVFQLLGLFLVFGETVEDDFEHTAEFAGLDHVDVELVEDLRVLGERLGEGGTALDVFGERADGGA